MHPSGHSELFSERHQSDPVCFLIETMLNWWKSFHFFTATESIPWSWISVSRYRARHLTIWQNKQTNKKNTPYIAWSRRKMSRESRILYILANCSWFDMFSWTGGHFLRGKQVIICWQESVNFNYQLSPFATGVHCFNKRNPDRSTSQIKVLTTSNNASEYTKSSLFKIFWESFSKPLLGCLTHFLYASNIHGYR